jgi:hypothetical protein
LVAINPGTNQVTAASSNNSNGLLGVVVGSNAATLAVTNTTNEIQVATTGTANLFVNNLNGPINVGDQIAPSPIEGVGMKATVTGKVVGVAQQAFDGKSPIKTVAVKAKSGGSQTATVGVIPVVVQVVYYTVPVKTAVPAFLQQFADTVAGKPVALIRLVIGGLILMAALGVAATLLFSAIRGSIIAIGRNPLARSSIYGVMFQAASVSAVILVVAVTMVYMVLHL